MTHHARASAWIALPEFIDELGGDSTEVLKLAGLTADDLTHTDKFLPYDAFIATLNAAAEQTGRPDFGMSSAERAGIVGLGLLGIAMSNAPTARAATDVCTRFMRANNTAATLSLTPLPGGSTEVIGLEIDYPADSQTVQLFERVLAMTHLVSKAGSGQAYAPLSVMFMHSRNAPMEDYVRVFGIEPTFGRAMTGIEVDQRFLDEPRASRSAELSDMAESFLNSIVAAAEVSIVDTVKRVAKVLIEMGECSPAKLARALRIHERTLQRRLKEAGSSFEMVRDEARKELFEMLLTQQTRSLTEIAMVLGYSNSSTLSRNCQRWFGDTPSNLRQSRIAA